MIRLWASVAETSRTKNLGLRKVLDEPRDHFKKGEVSLKGPVGQKTETPKEATGAVETWVGLLGRHAYGPCEWRN